MILLTAVKFVEVIPPPSQCSNDHFKNLLQQLNLAESVSRTDHKVCPRRTNYNEELKLVKQLKNLREIGSKGYIHECSRTNSRTTRSGIISFLRFFSKMTLVYTFLYEITLI